MKQKSTALTSTEQSTIRSSQHTKLEFAIQFFDIIVSIASVC